MEIISQYHEAVALFTARVFLGCLFFFQGYDAVFNVKLKNVISIFESDFSKKGIPRFFIVFASWYTTYTELICGVLLILGLFEYYALYLLSLNILIATIGFSINNPMWDTRFVFPRLVLLLILLIVPASLDKLSLDYLLFNH